jgi:iron complex outermembrane receptor protein
MTIGKIASILFASAALMGAEASCTCAFALTPAKDSSAVLGLKVSGDFGASFYGHKVYIAPDASLLFNYSNKKSRFYLSYSPSYLSETTPSGSLVVFGPDNASTCTSNYILDYRKSDNIVQFGGSHDITKDDVVGLKFSGTFSDAESSISPDESSTELKLSGRPAVTYTSSFQAKAPSSFLDANANYTHSFSGSGDKSLSFNLDYLYERNWADFGAGYFYPAGRMQYAPPVHNDQYVDGLSAAADFSATFYRTLKFASGVRWANTVAGNHVKDIIRENDYRYGEGLISAYLNLETAFSRIFTISAHLRYEHSFIDYHADSLGINKSGDSGHFFPELTFTYSPSQWKLSMNYSRGIERPSFTQLSPATIMADDGTYIVGNPYLLPQLSESFKFSVDYTKYFNFTLSHVIKQHYITETLDIDQETAFQTFVYNNFGTLSISSASLSATSFPATKWLSCSLLAKAFYMKTVSDNPDYGTTFVIEKPGYQLYGALDFTLPLGFGAHADASYISSYAVGQHKISSSVEMNMSVSKSVFHDRGAITLKWNDILRSSNIQDDYYAPGNADVPVLTFTQTYPTLCRITLGFTWNFGNPSAGPSPSLRITEEERRISDDIGGIALSFFEH